MKITIDVTEEDIREGERRVCRACPVALAMGRATGIKVYVTPGRVIFLTYPPARSSDLPEEATNFIRDFDNGSPVEPFSFELILPNVVAELLGQHAQN